MAPGRWFIVTGLDLVDYVDNFRRRVLQDALTEATAAYWRARAATFEDARPRPGDFHGQAGTAELADLDRRCRDSAEACRRHASLMLDGPPDHIRADVDHVLREVA